MNGGCHWLRQCRHSEGLPEPGTGKASGARLARPKILVLYHHEWTPVKTVAHHLESFHRFSRFDVSYVSSLAKCRYDLDCFSAVVLHYTVRVCHPGHIAASWSK